MNVDVLREAGTGLNLELLDAAVGSISGGDPQQAQHCAAVLDAFSLREDLLNFASEILHSKCRDQTKYIYLSATKKWIGESWTKLGDDVQEQFKSLIKSFICACVDNDWQQLSEAADQVLVAIALHEWPEEWASFLPDVVAQGSMSPAYCRNTLYIIEVLSSIIPLWMNNSDTGVRATKMALSYNAVFDMIYKLVVSALESNNKEMVRLSLLVLKNSCRLASVSQAVDSGFIGKLITTFGMDQDIMTLILELLEPLLTQKNWRHPHENPGLLTSELFETIVGGICSIFQNEDAINDNRLVSSLVEAVPKLLLCLSLEQESEHAEAFSNLLNVIMKVSYEGDEDCYASCAEFWMMITYRCLSRKRQRIDWSTYQPCFEPLSELVFQRMPDPFSIMSGPDPFGREKCVYIPEQPGYHASRAILTNMFQVQRDEMLAVFSRKLDSLVAGGWNKDAWSRFMWAVGSIAIVGQVYEPVGEFFQNCMNQILRFAAQSTDPEQGATIALFLAFMCAHFSNCFSKTPELVKALLSKTLSFLVSDNRRVQVFVLKTMSSMLLTNSNLIAESKDPNTPSILEELIGNLPQILAHVPYNLAYSVLETVSQCVSVVRNIVSKKKLIDVVTQLGLESLHTIMSKFEPASIQYNLEVRKIVNFNRAVMRNLAEWYLSAAAPLIPQLCEMQCSYSAVLIQHGNVENLTILSVVKARRAILKVLRCYMEIGGATQEGFSAPGAIMRIAHDFAEQPPKYRDGMVLSMFLAISSRCKAVFSTEIATIYTRLFLPVAQMVHDKTSTENKEVVNQLISLASYGCRFQSPFPYQLGPPELKVFLDTVIACCESFDKETELLALTCISDFYIHLEMAEPPNAKEILATFLPSHILFLFQLLTDTQHKSVLGSQIMALWSLMRCPYVREKCDDLFTCICEIFPTVSKEVHHRMLLSLLRDTINNNMHGFIATVTDFVVDLGSVSPQDSVIQQLDPSEPQGSLKEALEKLTGHTESTETGATATDGNVASIMENLTSIQSI